MVCFINLTVTLTLGCRFGCMRRGCRGTRWTVGIVARKWCHVSRCCWCCHCCRFNCNYLQIIWLNPFQFSICTKVWIGMCKMRYLRFLQLRQVHLLLLRRRGRGLLDGPSPMQQISIEIRMVNPIAIGIISARYAGIGWWMTVVLVFVFVYMKI